MVTKNYRITHIKEDLRFLVDFDITITDNEDVFKLNPILIYNKPIFLPFDWLLIAKNDDVPISCVEKHIVGGNLYEPIKDVKESFTLNLIDVICNGCSMIKNTKDIKKCKVYISYYLNDFYEENKDNLHNIVENFLKKIADGVEESWEIAVQKAKLNKALSCRRVAKKL